MNQPQKNTSHSSSDVHPICKNAPNPEKCEQFAEKLEDVNSNLKISDSVVSPVHTEGKERRS